MAAENLEPSEVIARISTEARHLAAVPDIGEMAIAGEAQLPEHDPSTYADVARLAGTFSMTSPAEATNSYWKRFKIGSPTR